MNWENIIIQLGISALIVAVGFKIAVLLITNWAKNDAERTKVVGAGFDAIIQRNEVRHEAVMATINEHQSAELKVLNGIIVSFSRLDAKIDTVMDLTPIREMQAARAVPSVIVDETEDTDPAAEPPPSETIQKIKQPSRVTPHQGVRAATGSEYAYPNLRPKKA